MKNLIYTTPNYEYIEEKKEMKLKDLIKEYGESTVTYSNDGHLIIDGFNAKKKKVIKSEEL